ncbi:hypothetical protein UFOVP669_52 [uncultured Caudovirales phage]|uniref:Uncharacterized protein n=1 Tax=uncultured Caudovirales phage TaxID=2100421 RepID=A0A6J5NGB5_9CAUD|nr:hypothetical protein UFOVP400_43 [uncultured Caudovirales phage]CAB4156255.1 hypothetical protein UFOVP669_52 [uncultured Caudovirales phage]CAB4213430.1 hypothetical protein UFOVP1449_20 [uncultured Caudovirales phage]
MSFVFDSAASLVKKVGANLLPKAATPDASAFQPPSTAATPAVQAASEAERRRQMMKMGRASTLLTGAGGASAGMIGTSKLLGD